MLRHILLVLPGLALAGIQPTGLHAGPVNPDISIVGQPFVRWTDDPTDRAARRIALDVGETEVLFDAALNPYARGTFTISLGQEGTSVEEGYFRLTRGLPWSLALKGGRYRAGFGRLNAVHPHAWPFADRPGALAAYLPGDEAFIETGAQLSELVALGDVALTLSADWLQGDSFRIAREPGGAANDPLAIDPESGDREGEPRPAALGRAAAFFPIGDGASAFEVGVSAAGGTNNVAAAARSTLLGVDVRAKLWRGSTSNLVLQGEWLRLDREDTAWDENAAAYTRTSVTPHGGYVFADYAFDRRYDAGLSYQWWQQPDAERDWNRGFGVFGGLALLEETTLFRVDWMLVQPARPAGATADPDAVQTVTLRVVYSMGPHKPHTF